MDDPRSSTAASPAAASPVQLIAFNGSEWTECELDSVPQIQTHLQRDDRVVWLNVDSIADAAWIQQLGELLGLHRLAVEDVLHVHQRAKVEEYAGHLFVVVRMAALEDGELATEQLSIFLFPRMIVTIQEGRPGDCLEPLRERLRRGTPVLRRAGADYLMYALLDAAIDSYFGPLETLGDRLDELEEPVDHRDSHTVIAELHRIRRNLLTTRRVVWPLRDAVGGLLRNQHPLIAAETQVHLRDCLDHTVQLIDLAETYREVCADLRELQFANISQRTNDVMRLLTLIATIFMPLSFIAGLYGMNFNTQASRWNMPELNWTLGYPLALALMAAVATTMLITFRRWGWLRRRQEVS